MSEWSVETLKEFVLTLFAEKDRAVQAALAAQKELATMALANADKAVAKAEIATEKRFDSVNEMRAMVEKVLEDRMPKSEGLLRLSALDKGQDDLQTRLAALEGKGRGFAGGWGWAVGVAGFVSLIVGVFLALRR